MKAPAWFGPALAIAQHADRVRSWPWWARLLHRLVPCPACEAEHPKTWRLW